MKLRTALLSSALSLLPAVCFAQTDNQSAADQGTVVVVTGIRHSLKAALDLKRSAPNLTDTITSQDIGKLPDENVADSIQRVPGVQISRESGEGQAARIRGLAATTFINGRPASSPGGSREFDMRNLTADFFQAVEVSKSVLASQPEGTLGGSVNLVTRKPLDFKKLTTSYSFEETYSNFADKMDPRATFFVADKTSGGHFGASLGLSYSQRSIRQDVAFNQSGLQIGTANTVTGWSLTNGQFVKDAAGHNYIRLNDYRFMSQLATRKRTGIDTTLQWKVNDELLLRLDATAAHLVNDNKELFMSALNGFAASNVTNLVLDNNGFMKSATVANSALNVDGRYHPEVFDSDMLGFNARWSHQRLTLTFDASTSFGRHQDWTDIVRFGGPLATVNYSSNGDSKPANLDIRTASTGAIYDFMTPSKFSPNLTFDRKIYNRQRNNVVDIDAVYDLDAGVFKNIKAGVHLTDFGYRTYTSNIGNEFNNTANPAFYSPSGTKLTAADAPLNQFLASTFAAKDGFFSGVDGNFPRQWLTYDYPGSNPEEGANRVRTTLNFTGKRVLDPLSVSVVSEKTQGAYVTTDIDTELGGKRLQANLGIRVVKTDLDSSGFDSASHPVDVRNSYTKVLPAANLKVDLSDKLILRAAAAKVMQRADLADLATSFNVQVGGGFATLGNPTLKPYESNQYDVGLEYYFSKEGLLSATLFNKDVRNFTVSQTYLADIPGYVPLNRAPNDPLGNQFFITQKVNGAGATIKGFELSYQQPFTFLPGWLQGFGTQVNYTRSDATTTNGAPYEGLARDTFNLIGYYERGPFNARFAYNYRSKVATIQGSNLNTNSLGAVAGLYQFAQPQGYLDGSMSWQYNDRIKFTVEGVNLTGTQQVLYVGQRSTVNEVYRTDSRVTFGIKLTM